MNLYSNRRWAVLLGALPIQLSIGAIYAWSLLNGPLAQDRGWSADAVFTTYSIAIFVFALSTLLSGKLVDKVGPRLVATIGGLLYGGGMLLASTAQSLTVLYLGYGVLSGMGVGFAYVCPISTLVKWFPEKKGLITGVAVGAFGGGSLIFKSVIELLLKTQGINQTFFTLGLVYMALVVGGAQLLSLPEKTSHEKQSQVLSTDFTPSEMIRSRVFHRLWVLFFLGCMPGLLVIGLARDIGITYVGLDAATAANAVAIIGLFNAGGRLLWGAASDRWGSLRVLNALFLLTALSLFSLALIPPTVVVFFLALSLIAMNFGGFLALYPVITGSFFGLRYLGTNYGLMYQAYGVAALAGPLVAGVSGTLTGTFLVAAVFAVIGALLTPGVDKPTKKSQGTPHPIC